MKKLGTGYVLTLSFDAPGLTERLYAKIACCHYEDAVAKVKEVYPEAFNISHEIGDIEFNFMTKECLQEFTGNVI